MLDYKAIGKQIKIARIQKDITQEALAEMVEISATHLSNIEGGKKSAGLETLVRIAKNLDLSMDKLLCYEPGLPMQRNFLTENISRELSDCTSSEMIVIEEALRQVKQALRTAYDNK